MAVPSRSPLPGHTRPPRRTRSAGSASAMQPRSDARTVAPNEDRFTHATFERRIRVTTSESVVGSMGRRKSCRRAILPATVLARPNMARRSFLCAGLLALSSLEVRGAQPGVAARLADASLTRWERGVRGRLRRWADAGRLRPPGRRPALDAALLAESGQVPSRRLPGDTAVRRCRRELPAGTPLSCAMDSDLELGRQRRLGRGLHRSMRSSADRHPGEPQGPSPPLSRSPDQARGHPRQLGRVRPRATPPREPRRAGAGRRSRPRRLGPGDAIAHERQGAVPVRRRGEGSGPSGHRRILRARVSSAPCGPPTSRASP